ncbi:MAG: hypothetical protein R6U70_08780 [Bacillota bacterium]
MPYIKGILEAYGIPVYESEGFEADDLIGTMSRQAADTGYKTYMMTSDKDYMQLVNDKVMMYKPATRGGPAEVMGPEEVCKKFDIDEPAQVIDILALMGDSADNIPGAIGRPGPSQRAGRRGGGEPTPLSRRLPGHRLF